MTLNPGAQAVLDLIAEAGRPSFEEMTVPECREAYVNSRKALQPDPIDIAEIRDLAMPGPAGEIPLRLYRGAPQRRRARSRSLFTSMAAAGLSAISTRMTRFAANLRAGPAQLSFRSIIASRPSTFSRPPPTMRSRQPNGSRINAAELGVRRQAEWPWQVTALAATWQPLQRSQHVIMAARISHCRLCCILSRIST